MDIIANLTMCPRCNNVFRYYDYLSHSENCHHTIENNDNNNVMLKQVLDGLDKVDTKIDEKIYGKTEIKVEEEKEYKTFRDKFNG